MPSRASTEKPRLLPALAARAALFGAFLFLLSSSERVGALPPPDQPPSDAVGAIEGDAIALEGPMTVRVENGQVKTVLRSGSDIRVKSGQARIELVEGGEIVICGPAHLSVLKSGGALTLALDSGTIHARVSNQPSLTVYTAQIQAQPIGIGGGSQDFIVGFDAPGVMVVRAKSGAMRLEQQLTGQAVVVPQAGDIMLTNGALDSFRSGAGHCSCELQLVRNSPPPHASTETSLIASAKDIKPKPAERKQPASPTPPTVDSGQPVYQVFMPPLRYDASAAVQDQLDPSLILLVRRVRVRPTLIFEGEVAGDPVAAANQAAPPLPVRGENAPPQANSKNSSTAANESVFERVRSFFRRLWSGNS